MHPNDPSSVMILSTMEATTKHVTSPQHIDGDSSWELSRKCESHGQGTGAVDRGNIHDLPLRQPSSARVVQSFVDSPSIVIPELGMQSSKPLRKRAMKAKLAEEFDDRRRATAQPRMKKARVQVSRSSSEDKNNEMHGNDGEEHQDRHGGEESGEQNDASAMSEAELLMASCLLKLSHPKTSPGSNEEEETTMKHRTWKVQADVQTSSPPAVPSTDSLSLTEDNVAVPISPASLLHSATHMGTPMSWMPAASGPNKTAGVPFGVSSAPASTMATAAIPFLDPATGACVAVPILWTRSQEIPQSTTSLLQQQQRQFMQSQNFHHQQRQLMQQQKLEQLHRATTRALPHEGAQGGIWMLDPTMSMATTASPAFSRRLPTPCYSSSSFSAWSGNKPNLVQGNGGSLSSATMRYNKENKAPRTFSAQTIAVPSSLSACSGVGNSLNPSCWMATKMDELSSGEAPLQHANPFSSDRKRKLMWSRQKYLESNENQMHAHEKAIVPPETCSKSNSVGRDKRSKRSKDQKSKETQEEEEIFVDYPRPQDVLSGRGNGVALHDGNRQFRAWVKHYRMEYQQATRSCKGALTRRVIQHVQECGGRFLEQVVAPSSSSSEAPSSDDANADASMIQTTWRQLSNARIWEKTSQALREKPNL